MFIVFKNDKLWFKHLVVFSLIISSFTACNKPNDNALTKTYDNTQDITKFVDDTIYIRKTGDFEVYKGNHKYRDISTGIGLLGKIIGLIDANAKTYSVSNKKNSEYRAYTYSDKSAIDTILKNNNPEKNENYVMSKTIDSKYDEFGFDEKLINKDTGTVYNMWGFKRDRTHKNGTKYDEFGKDFYDYYVEQNKVDFENASDVVVKKIECKFTIDCTSGYKCEDGNCIKF